MKEYLFQFHNGFVIVATNDPKALIKAAKISVFGSPPEPPIYSGQDDWDGVWAEFSDKHKKYCLSMVSKEDFITYCSDHDLKWREIELA